MDATCNSSISIHFCLLLRYNCQTEIKHCSVKKVSILRSVGAIDSCDKGDSRLKAQTVCLWFIVTPNEVSKNCKFILAIRKSPTMENSH